MTTWILLRGLTRERRHWGEFPDIFRKEIPDARVLTPDLPGNGALCAEESPASVAAMVTHYRHQLAREEIPPPYHLLAMSLGAMVAVAWATRYPEEITRCVLINTSLRPFSPFYQRLKPRSYLQLLKLALPFNSTLERERQVLTLTSRHAQNPTEILNNWAKFRQENPVNTRNALRQLFAAMRFQASLTPPLSPVLILTSQQDALVDSACSRQIAACWNSAFAAHPEAGHDLPLDDGPWVAKQVRDWLKKPLC